MWYLLVGVLIGGAFPIFAQSICVVIALMFLVGSAVALIYGFVWAVKRGLSWLRL